MINEQPSVACNDPAMDITKLREENKMLWEQIESMKQTNLALVKKLEGLK